MTMKMYLNNNNKIHTVKKTIQCLIPNLNKTKKKKKNIKLKIRKIIRIIIIIIIQIMMMVKKNIIQKMQAKTRNKIIIKNSIFFL